MKQILPFSALLLAASVAFANTPAQSATSSAPLAPATARADAPAPFGASLFAGKFSAEQFVGFNPDYLIAVGDRIQLRIWGAITVEQTMAVDAQGAIFIPQVGPVQVRGLRNAELNEAVNRATARTFRNNVSVYAALEAAQPVKLFVTGAVKSPGLYGGTSGDSILRFLDKAGGVDEARGAYSRVELLRAGSVKAVFNLYDFLLKGRLDALQLHDGDVLLVKPRGASVAVQGAVASPALIELDALAAPRASELFGIVGPTSGATHFKLIRTEGTNRTITVHPMTDAERVVLSRGDAVEVSAERRTSNVSIKLTGAHAGAQSLTVAAGTSLADVVAQLTANEMTAPGVVQVFRRSVAERQKEALEQSLSQLEQTVLTAQLKTKDEGELRRAEAELVQKFIEKARRVEPRGQVVLPAGTDLKTVLLEEGDVVHVPARSSLVLVNGQVRFPSAVAFAAGKGVDYYVARTGGTLQDNDLANVVIVRQDGSALSVKEAGALKAGDELYVLPKVDTKTLAVTSGITEILFRVAFIAKVALGL